MLAWLRRLIHPIDGTARPAVHDPGVLLCEFRGVIRDGSSGNGQVDLIERTIDEALSAGSYRAIVLDLSEVRYTFGNHAFELIWSFRERGLQLALVVSTSSEQLVVVAERTGGWIVCRSRTIAFEKIAAERP